MADDAPLHKRNTRHGMPAITPARCKCAANAMSQLEDAKKTKSQMMTEARIAITVQYAAEFAKASRPIRCITAR